MSTLRANIIDSHSSSTEFKETITANGDNQWLDTYGVIKANRDTIAESITIPSGTNGLSSGPVTIADGHTITDQLDQLYRDINNGKFGSDAKTGEWFVGISSVKTAFPKP